MLYRVAQKTSRTFACIIQPSGRSESVQKYICNDQTSPNMCRNFRPKHFCISRDTNKIASHAIKQCLQASRHLRCRLSQAMPKHYSIGQITSQMISRKYAEWVLHSPLPLLLDAFSTAIWLFWFWMADVDIMPFVSDNILKIFEVRKLFTPLFIDKFLQDIPNWIM